MQQELAILSFLESLRNAGIAIPQGISFLDSSDRDRFREPTVSQGRVWHEESAQTRLLELGLSLLRCRRALIRFG